MNWYRFSKFDRILIVFSAAGLILSTFFIFEDRWIHKLLSNKAQQREKIGAVKTSINDVRQRHEDAFAWVPLEADADVYQGDSIFTSSRSEAIIMTERGERISISPNSLVVINAHTDSIRLDIDYGSVLGEVGKDKKLLIASGGDITEFKGEDAIVKVDVSKDKNLVVNVIEGQVEVLSDEGRQTLGPNQNAQISETGGLVDLNNVQIDLLTPVPERVLKPDESRDLVLTWRANYQFHEYQIEIARDLQFTKLLLKEKTTQQIFRPTALPTNEKIYWRISASPKSSKNTVKSVVAGFTLVEDKPPTFVFPKDNMRLNFEEQPIEDGQNVHVTLRWQPKAISSKWEIQYARSSDFSQNLKIIESKEVYNDLGALSEGTFYVRIRAKDWADALWSETLSFTIARKSPATLRPPQVLTAEEEFLLVTKAEGYTAQEIHTASPEQIYSYVESIPELAWNNIPGATSYEIEIAKDRQFNQVVKKAETPSSRYSWNEVQLGNFYWRIRSLSAGNRRGPFTVAQPLKVKLAPPQSRTKEKIVEEVTSLSEMEAAPAPFLLHWAPTLFTSRYELEFDKNSLFRKPLRIITANSFKKVQAPAAGVYFWRVRSLDNKGQPITTWTDGLRFDYNRVYLSPETTKELKAIYPNNETIMLIGRGESKINFRWVTPIKNSKYRFQMSDTSDFSKPRLDFVTDKDFFLFQKELPTGWFYWRLRVENSNFTSPWTTAYQFQIQHEETAFNFASSEQKQEEEIKKFEQEQQIIRAQEYKERLERKSELERLELEARPQLEAPSYLSNPELTVLEVRPHKIAKDLEGIPDERQSALLNELPNFEWVPVSGATTYRFEIATDATFSKLIESVKVSRPSYRWLKAQPGTFYWRVRALSPQHRDSAFAQSEPYTVTTQRPQMITPHALMLVNSPVLLKWSSVPFAHSYEVQWSTERKFENPISLTTPLSRLNQTVTQEGIYYWRVRPLNAAKQPLLDFSEPRPLNIVLAPSWPAPASEPVLLFPKDQQTFETTTEPTLRISFNWQESQSQGQYTLQFARDKEFSEVIQSYNAKNNNLIADVSTESANIFWRLIFSSKGKVLWRSQVRQIQFSNFNLRQPATQQKVPAKALPARAK